MTNSFCSQIQALCDENFRWQKFVTYWTQKGKILSGPQDQPRAIEVDSVADPHLLLCGSGSGIHKLSIWILGGKKNWLRNRPKSGGSSGSGSATLVLWVRVGVGVGAGPKKRLRLQPKRAAPATLSTTAGLWTWIKSSTSSQQNPAAWLFKYVPTSTKVKIKQTF